MCVLLPVLISPNTCQANKDKVSEYQIKAVYLYNFLHFITWPKTLETQQKNRTMTIGIIGDSPIKTSLEALQKNLQRTNKKPINLVQFGDFKQGIKLIECDILFVSKSEDDNFQTIINSLNSKPILTISEGFEFLEAGGMISFKRNQNKIRYVVNIKATQQAGLKLSSQLLKIALEVIQDQP